MLTEIISRSDQLVMTPVWRLSNGYGPSWHFGQAQVTTDTSFQVIIKLFPVTIIPFPASPGDH